MRVAVEKIKGVESVEVTLKRGVAYIRLTEGNTATLARIRQVVKDAGYVSRDATVTVSGTVESRGSQKAFRVAGTGETFVLAADSAAPTALEAATQAAPGARLELTGTVPPPDSKAKGVDMLRVQLVR